MKKERILRWVLPAAFLLLCALTLFFFSRYTRSGGELVTRDTVALTNRLGMPAAAFAVAALCLLGLFCYTLFRGMLDWPLLLLALAAACQSFYWLREFDMRFQMSLPLNIPLAAVFPQLFLLLPLSWLITRMGRWRRWCALAAGFWGRRPCSARCGTSRPARSGSMTRSC